MNNDPQITNQPAGLRRRRIEMKTQKLTEMLKERESVAKPEEMGLDGNENVSLPLVDPKNADLTVWAWESENGDCGFLRDDSAGWRAIGSGTREDQLTLAAWNVDFDIRLLKDFLDDDDLALALEDAQANSWGFDGERNTWDEE